MIFAKAPAWDVSSPITPTLIGSDGLEAGCVAVFSVALGLWADAIFKLANGVVAKVMAKDTDMRAAILSRDRREFAFGV